MGWNPKPPRRKTIFLKAEHKESGLDWKNVVILALAIVLAASVYTRGSSSAAKQPANASEFLNAYLNSSNLTVEELQGIRNELDLRIYKLQIENEPPVQMVVLSDSSCQNCNIDRIVKISQQLFPTLEVSVVDYNSTGGKILAKTHEVTLLPAYIFGDSVEQAANFNQIKPDLVQVGADYVINPQITGAAFPVYD